MEERKAPKRRSRLRSRFIMSVLLCVGYAGFRWTRSTLLSHDSGPGPHKLTRRLLQDINLIPNSCSSAFDKSGGLAVWIFISIYLFLALSMVCDDYFIPALEIISARLELSDDVAGATFMAAGSSAPEMATSLVGTLLTESDVGIGTIVGSAIFQILAIIAFTAIFAGMPLKLDAWPLMRDATFYLFAVIALLLVFLDGEVHWYEALIFLLIYSSYITLMYFNRRIFSWIKERRLLNKVSHSSSSIQSASAIVLVVESKTDKDSTSPPSPSLNQEEKFVEPDAPGRPKKQLPPLKNVEYTNISVYGPSLVPSQEGDEKPAGGKDDSHSSDQKVEDDNQTPVISENRLQSNADLPPSPDTSELANSNDNDSKRDIISRIIGFLGAPIDFVYKHTIPKCSEIENEKYYALSFFTSIAWIGLISYVLVEVAEKIGCIVGLSDTVMGLTLLASAWICEWDKMRTSVPDCLSSVIVAKQGKGDMAVSNAIGSNVFDVLMGLGVPWIIKTAIVEPGSVIELLDQGELFEYVIILLIFLIAYIVTVVSYKFTLTRSIGTIFVSMYIVFLVYSILRDEGTISPWL